MTGYILLSNHYWTSMTSKPFLKTSIYRINGLLKFRYANTDTVLIICLSLSKAYCYFYLYTKGTSFASKLVINMAMVKNPWICFLKNPIIFKNNLICVWLAEAGWFTIILTFLRSDLILNSLTINLRYLSCFLANSHFFSLSFSLICFKASKTFHIYLRCSFIVWKNIIILSRYTIMKSYRYDPKTLIIKC